MRRIQNITSQLLPAIMAGMMVSCIGMKTPEVTEEVNILNVRSTPYTNAVDLTAQTDNDQVVSNCGFFWGKEKLENRVEAEFHPDGSFNSSISGLEPGTSFVFCAFIGNGIDEKRSETLSFKTIEKTEDNPENPEQPEDPDNPDQPEQPEQPENPEQPEQTAFIPDPNFKSALLRKFDTDRDGELSFFEINSVQYVDITDDDIESVEGIEYFEGLYEFYINGEDVGYGVYSGKLTSVDISKNQKLQEFGISHENVTYVDASQNPGLSGLHLFSCPISSVNLNGADNLVIFGIAYSNQLSKLTIKDKKKLDEVHLDNNVLTELHLENLPKLRYLDCSGNKLTTLDISECPELEAFDCSGNPALEILYMKKDQRQKLKGFTRDESVRIIYLD